MKKILTTKEASEYLKCSTQHVRNLVAQGKLKSSNPDGSPLTFKFLDILMFQSKNKSADTLILIGSCDPETKSSLISGSTDFASNNQMPNITVLDEDYEGILHDPLLVSRHLVAELSNRKPKHLVIANIMLIPSGAMACIVECCRIFNINLHCFSGFFSSEGEAS